MRDSHAGLGVEPRDTARYLAAAREHWALVVTVLAIAVGAALVYSARLKDSYAAQADVLVSPVDPADQALTGLGLLRDPTGSVFTTGRLLATPQVQDAVLRKLRLHETRQALMESVTIVPIQQSNIVSIVGHSSKSTKAAELANTFASSLIEQRTRVFQARLKLEIERVATRRKTLGPHPGGSQAQVAAQLDNEFAYLTSFVGQNDPTLAIWAKAVPPDFPVPKKKTGIFAAFFAALLLGTGLAMTLELVSGRIRREYELVGKLAILARVPRMRFGAARRYLAGKGALPARSWEAYRVLRARIAAATGEGGGALVVTSAVKGEGKTMTALNLALALAASGEDVVLVDANLRNSGIGKALGLEAPDLGLRALLTAVISVETAAKTKAAVAAALTEAGPRRPNLRLVLPEPDASPALDLLDRRRVRAMFEALAPHGTVVVDAPALTEYGEAHAIAGAADAVVLCVRLGRSGRAGVEETLQIVARDHLPVVGGVVTTRRGAPRRGIQAIAPVEAEAAVTA